MAKRYSYRILNIWEQKSEEEKEMDREFEKRYKKNQERVLERIRSTEVNGKVYVSGLGWVNRF